MDISALRCCDGAKVRRVRYTRGPCLYMLLHNAAYSVLVDTLEKDIVDYKEKKTTFFLKKSAFFRHFSRRFVIFIV